MDCGRVRGMLPVRDRGGESCTGNVFSNEALNEFAMFSTLPLLTPPTANSSVVLVLVIAALSDVVRFLAVR